jgi:hypothetical protein
VYPLCTPDRLFSRFWRCQRVVKSLSYGCSTGEKVRFLPAPPRFLLFFESVNEGIFLVYPECTFPLGCGYWVCKQRSLDISLQLLLAGAYPRRAVTPGNQPSLSRQCSSVTASCVPNTEYRKSNTNARIRQTVFLTRAPMVLLLAPHKLNRSLMVCRETVHRHYFFSAAHTKLAASLMSPEPLYSAISG